MGKFRDLDKFDDEHEQHLSDDRRIKIGIAVLGRVCSATDLANRSAAQKGHIVSKEARAKISAASKNQIRQSPSEETRAKISASNKGKTKQPPSAETRAKLAEAGRKLVQTPDGIFNSKEDAAKHYGVRTGQILYWIRKSKKDTFYFITRKEYEALQ